MRPTAIATVGTLYAVALFAACRDASSAAPTDPQRSLRPSASAAPARAAADQLTNTHELAELYQLQAAFHAAASVRDPVNGDSPAVITERIREMLALWTEDGVLQLAVGGARDGVYAGRGDPDDPATCPAPSGNPANRGTLCTFFKYVGGSFQPQNKFVSLAPSYKTHFDVHGATGTVYFECHYFDVATGNPASSNNAPWTPKSHVQATGSVQRVEGQWLFSYLNAPVPPVPVGH
jgi:hypothetical protein